MSRNQHIGLDMLISTIETLATFLIAYPTAVVLGKVLLQTSPERQGGSMGTASKVIGGSGPMEEFSRAIREVSSRLLTYIKSMSHCTQS